VAGEANDEQPRGPGAARRGEYHESRRDDGLDGQAGRPSATAKPMYTAAIRAMDRA
jgi:hypothetical protein